MGKIGRVDGDEINYLFSHAIQSDVRNINFKSIFQLYLVRVSVSWSRIICQAHSASYLTPTNVIDFVAGR